MSSSTAKQAQSREAAFRAILKKIIPPLIRRQMRRAINVSRYHPFFRRNSWWSKLAKIRNCECFPELSATARRACSEIREAYVPILKKTGSI